KCEKAVGGCQPEESLGVLANIYDGELLGLRLRSLNPVVSKCLSDWIILIQKLITSDPDDTGPVLEQSSDKHPTQTPEIRGVMEEDLEFVAVVPVQSI